MDTKKINELLQLVDKTAFTHFEYEDEKTKIVLKKEQPLYAAPSVLPQAPVITAAEVMIAAEDETNLIKAPLVGTIYLASSPEEAPFVQVGTHIKAGDTVCLIEAMKMFNEIKAPVDCIIREILVDNGVMTEFGTPLFRIEPND